MSINWLFGRGRSPRAPVLVALLLLFNALLLRATDPPALARLREFAFDTYQRLKPRTMPEDLPVRIIDIDEAALAEYGQWPWPRTVMAELVTRLAEAGAAAIALDIVFAEPDRFSVGLPGRPSNDQIFAEAIEAAPVITGFGFDLKGYAKPPRRFAGFVHNSGERDNASLSELIAQFIPQQAGAVKTIDVLEAAAKGNGSITPEIEGAIIRRVPMLFRLAGQRDEDLFPAISVEALRVAQGASSYLVRWSGAQSLASFGARTGVGGIRVGNTSLRTDAQGAIWLYDTGHIPGRFVSARDVLKGTVPADKLDGQIVFLGTSALGLKDLRNTPLQNSVPGVEIHAQIVEQVLSQTFLERPDYADGLEFVYLAVVGLALVLLLPRLTAGRMGLVALLFIAIGIGVPWLAFDYARLLIDPVYPSATFAAIYVSGSALAFMRAERDKREIRGAFNLYLSSDQVEAVVQNPELLKLGGEQREITVMFSDVRGFTRIAEQFDPHGLTRFMNQLLTPMTDIIHAHSGTIDKYMGDAIMAFWNAPLDVPNHARLACEAALEMQAQVAPLNAMWKAEAEATGRPYLPVAIGIGLNTGQATVGNFGSQQRLTYSCLGDQVNLASRLEGLCKVYRTGMIIGENTLQQVAGFAALELDLVLVKGKTRPERIYALLGNTEVAERPEHGTLFELQSTFLALYRKARFSEALALLEACSAAAGALGWNQAYYQLMQERLEALIADPPADWSGVYVATEK